MFAWIIQRGHGSWTIDRVAKPVNRSRQDEWTARLLRLAAHAVTIHNSAMDMTSHIRQLAVSRDLVHDLVRGTTTVACFGSRALLSLFVCAAPFPDSVVGAVTTEAEALELIRRHRPTFLFATQELEAGNGLSLMRSAHEQCPDLRMLLILQSPTAQLLQQALELGCNGVVVESHLAKGAMVDAIRAVIGGGIYTDALGVDALRATSRGDGPEPLETLSEREQEVLQLLTRGYTNKEMAEALIVSAETIKTHVTNILGKLQAKDRTHAAVIGIRRGLISGE
jgi:DNA-binding NarL/FixJ family response regulator